METNPQTENGMNRKRFIVLTATSLAAAGCAGCQALGSGSAPSGSKNVRIVDAGPGSNYSTEGVYEGFRQQGFFLVRSHGKLSAISSYCTHRHCKLEAETDHSFYCPCHGSTFDPVGKVTDGPATRDLPNCPLSIDARGHVIVKVI